MKGACFKPLLSLLAPETEIETREVAQVCSLSMLSGCTAVPVV